MQTPPRPLSTAPRRRASLTKSRPTTAVKGKDRAKRAGVSVGVYPGVEDEEDSSEEGGVEDGAWTAETAAVTGREGDKKKRVRLLKIRAGKRRSGAATSDGTTERGGRRSVAVARLARLGAQAPADSWRIRHPVSLLARGMRSGGGKPGGVRACAGVQKKAAPLFIAGSFAINSAHARRAQPRKLAHSLASPTHLHAG
jgi:hypothetical protein